MGTSTLTDRSTGQTILDTFFNDIHGALNSDFVGRNSSGVATLGQNLGTNALPWGSLYATSFILNGSAVDTSLLTAPKNRIVSGAVRSGSNQPLFITPNGAAASFTVDGATTNLVLDVDGAAVTVSTDITKSSLTVGPSTTATALVDESTAADQAATRTWGEYGAEKETITVDNMGAEFQTYIGQWQIIEITGVGTEYALAYIKSTTELTNVFRGFFFDSSGNPVQRTGFTDNDTITILSTGWVFVENDGATVDVSYVTPIRSYTAPSSPATGDYWYDMDNQTWKRYDGASFQIINRTLIGVVGIDSTNCVCARSFDFYQEYDEKNDSEFTINSTEIVEMKYNDSKVNIYGSEYNFYGNLESWNITTDLAGSADMYNATEQASTVYYGYMTDEGETYVADIEPQYRPDLRGWYNPHNPWRCLFAAYNDSGSDITMVDDVRFGGEKREKNATIRDEKSDTTEGGGFTSGSPQTRTLNTTYGDTEFYILSSNQITLMPGKYSIDAHLPAYRVNKHKASLYDITNSAFIIVGGNSHSDSSSGGTVYSLVSGEFYVEAPTVFELRHECFTTNGTNGFGRENSFGEVEVYSMVNLKKIS